MKLGLVLTAVVASLAVGAPAILVGACASGDSASAVVKSDAGASNGTTGTKAGGGTGDTDAGASGGDGASDAASAADSALPSAHTTGNTLTVNGKTRTYDITVPLDCSAAKKLPIVFVLHGDDGRGSDLYGAAFPIEDAAAAAGDEAIFVYPDGHDDSTNQNGSAWNIYDDPGVFPYTSPDPSGNEDVDYFDAMVTTFGALACGDASRVFVTGVSNGGYMTNQLARWRSGTVKAGAPQSGGPPSGATDSDYPKAPYCVGTTGAVPMLIVHGSADKVVDPSLGQQAASYWDMANGCAQAASDCSAATNDLVVPPVTPTIAVSPSPCVTSTGCTAGEPVILCFIQGMGHQVWSSAPTAIWGLFRSIP
jgi:polyhydroxybutyrate depolymerase